MKQMILNLLYPLFVLLLVLLIWQIAAWSIDVDLILPTPLAAFQNLKEYLEDSKFWISVGWTLLRCLESFFFAFIVALACSLLAYLNKTCEKLFNPFMAFIRAIPTMAIILILVISISPSQAPVIIAFIVICPTLYQTFLESFKSIDTTLIEMIHLYQVPKKKQIFKFYIPSILPMILNNSATGFSLNMKLVIAAEALALTRNSIGNLMQSSKVSLEVENLFALTIIAVLLGIICELAIKFLAKRVCKYA
ncbi:MAG: ABC transporter permease subunit [Anaeroplasmataceae bacterium]|jgi:ABC-type nitrate/sulfonate/bicarbonate transport system, permease component|nr:ABC transporter permease subunit [Anaeroplasmataceae bacterium]